MASHVRVAYKTKDLPKSRRRWEVSYVDPLTGRKRTKGAFATKRDADDWRAAHEHSRRERTYLSASDGDVLFSDAAREWLESQRKIKPRTRESYEDLLFGPRSSLARTFGSAPVRVIGHDDVDRWVASLWRDGNGRAPTTVRNAFFLLQKVLKEQVRRRRIATNPCADVELPQITKPRDDDDDERHYLTPAEVERLARTLPGPYDLLVRLAAYTGLRAGEIAGLQVRDFDLHEGTIRVARTVSKGRSGLRYDTPKTPHSRRVVPLDPVLAEELASYVRAHRAAAGEWYGRHGEPHPGDRLPLFVGSALGGRTTGAVRLDYGKLHNHAQWYATHWARSLRAAGLHPSVHFHDLRHTCASWLLQAGLSSKEIQEQLGHASVMITIDRYAHLDKSASRGNVRRALATHRAESLAAEKVVPLRRPS